MKRKWLAVMLMLLMIVTVMPDTVKACAVQVTTEDVTTNEQNTENTADSQFLVKIRYGIDSLVAYNANTPVQVTVTNQGEDFVGELTITVVREYYQNYAYSNDISLPAGETKSYFMTLPAISNMSNCVVRILDAKGRTKYERTIMNSVNISSDCIIGVLSDDYTALNYLDGMAQYIMGNTFSFRIGQMTEETMPDIASALATCKIIVIDNYDTSKLSDAQYTALRQWVENGGILLLGTGSEHTKTLSRFQDDFVSGRIGNLEKKKMAMTGLVQVYSTSTDDSDSQNQSGTEQAEDDLATATLTPDETDQLETSDELDLDVLNISVDGGTPVEKVANGDLFIQKQVGLGKVVVCKTALSMEPFSGYDFNVNVIAGVLKRIATQDILNNLNGNTFADDAEYVNSYMIDSVNGAKMPKSGKYILLFVIYVMLVGPGVYLLLRWRDKSKALWIAIPIVTLVFTAGVYVVSINDTVRDPMVTSFNVEMYEETSKTVVSGIQLKNPKSQAFEVNLKNDYSSVRPMDSDSYMSNFFNRQAEICTIKELPDHTVLRQSKAQAFTPFYTVAKAVVPTEQNIDMDIKAYRSGFEGTITNRLEHDLVDVVVYIGGYACYFDRIAAGQTVEISRQDQKQITDIYMLSEFLDMDAYSKNRKQYNHLQNIQYAMSSSFYQLQSDDGFVAGFEDGAVPDVVADKNVVEYGENMALKQFSVRFADVKGVYSNNIHRDYMIDSSDEWDIQSGYMYNSTEIEVEYDFGEDDINTLYNLGFGLNTDGNVDTTCYLWNETTKSWDEIFVGDTDEAQIKKDNYTSDHTVKLRYVSNMSLYGNCMVPTIAGGEN